MVTFVCYYCDQTLKKKQIERHFSCPRPFKFICIDCHQTFVGLEHKAHTSCMTEQTKFWGQYAQGKPNKKQKLNQDNASKTQEQSQQQVKQQQNGKTTQDEVENNNNSSHNTNGNTIKDNCPELKNNHKAENSSTKQINEENNQAVEWKGWKKTIKYFLKQKKGLKMKLSKLKKLVIDEYLKAYPEIDQEMAAEKFDSKINQTNLNQYDERFIRIVKKQQ